MYRKCGERRPSTNKETNKRIKTRPTPPGRKRRERIPPYRSTEPPDPSKASPSIFAFFENGGRPRGGSFCALVRGTPPRPRKASPSIFAFFENGGRPRGGSFCALVRGTPYPMGHVIGSAGSRTTRAQREGSRHRRVFAPLRPYTIPAAARNPPRPRKASPSIFAFFENGGRPRGGSFFARPGSGGLKSCLSPCKPAAEKNLTPALSIFLRKWRG